MQDWQLCEIIMKTDFVPELFIHRHSNHRFNCTIGPYCDSRYSVMHKRCPGTSFSVNLTTPSDIFEAISSKFVRTRTPNSHVEVRRPISAHGANYMISLANSPIGQTREGYDQKEAEPYHSCVDQTHATANKSTVSWILMGLREARHMHDIMHSGKNVNYLLGFLINSRIRYHQTTFTREGCRAASRKPWPAGQIWPADLIQLARVGMLSELMFLLMSTK